VRLRLSAYASRSAGSYPTILLVILTKGGPRPSQRILSSVDLERPSRAAASRTHQSIGWTRGDWHRLAFCWHQCRAASRRVCHALCQGAPAGPGAPTSVNDFVLGLLKQIALDGHELRSVVVYTAARCHMLPLVQNSACFHTMQRETEIKTFVRRRFAAGLLRFASSRTCARLVPLGCDP
jgi:hypothetical protein